MKLSNRRQKTIMYPFVKRLTDILLSGAALVLLSPVLFLIAVLVRLNLGSPILFSQTRPGKDGAPFQMYKFRTMRPPAANETGLPSEDGRRLTRLGSILRSLSIDELPELWNVLRGDMSIVGPRPLLMSYLERYNAEQFRRHEVRPGITGWAQINGRNTLSWEERFKLDVWYVDHASLQLDFLILFRTFFAVLSRKGISAEGSATMHEFKGSPKS